MVKTTEEAERELKLWLESISRPYTSCECLAFFPLELFRYISPAELFGLLNLLFSFRPKEAVYDIFYDSLLVVPFTIHLLSDEVQDHTDAAADYLSEVEAYIRDKVVIPEDVKIFEYFE